MKRSTPRGKLLRVEDCLNLVSSYRWRVHPLPNGCIHWGGPLNKGGYGVVGLNGTSVYAHRVAYIAAKGGIPPSMSVDHRCLDRSCVNPEHLEVVTHAENGRRAMGGAAHARNHPDVPATHESSRHCRECKRFYSQRSRARVSLA